MSFPVLPLLLLGGAGVAVWALTQNSTAAATVIPPPGVKDKEFIRSPSDEKQRADAAAAAASNAVAAERAAAAAGAAAASAAAAAGAAAAGAGAAGAGAAGAPGYATAGSASDLAYQRAVAASQNTAGADTVARPGYATAGSASDLAYQRAVAASQNTAGADTVARANQLQMARQADAQRQLSQAELSAQRAAHAGGSDFLSPNASDAYNNAVDAANRAAGYTHFLMHPEVDPCRCECANWRRQRSEAHMTNYDAVNTITDTGFVSYLAAPAGCANIKPNSGELEMIWEDPDCAGGGAAAAGETAIDPFAWSQC